MMNKESNHIDPEIYKLIESDIGEMYFREKSETDQFGQ